MQPSCRAAGEREEFRDFIRFSQRLVQPRPALAVVGKAEARGRERCPVIPSDGKVEALTVFVPRA
jgi:hypothetical protein